MTDAHLTLISVAAFFLAAFFAGSETAFLATDRIRLRHRAGAGDRRAKLVIRYVDDPEYLLSVVLIGTNLGVIGCTSTFTALMMQRLGGSGATAATIILVPALLVFQEIIPKGIFLYYADRMSLLSIYPLRFFAAVLFPVIKAFSALTGLVAAVFRFDRIGRKISMTMEELLFHLEGSRNAGLISTDTMTLATRAFRMLDCSALDVMLPLDRVVMAEEGLPLEVYQALFKEERFSRVPVYRGSRQCVIGFLSIRALLGARRGKSGEPELEAPYIVEADAPIAGIMVRMKSQGCHMAMVRNAHGEIAGMTTLEDILERLVGAIADEFH